MKMHIAEHLKRNHNFGIELPKEVNEAIEINKKNGDTFWQNATAIEIES